MKRFVLAVAATAVTVGGVVASAGEILDGVAAIANDRIITYSEVREYVQPVVQQLRRNYSGSNLVAKVQAAQMDALNNLIERALIIQEFKDKGYSFPETVIDEQFNDVITSDFGGDRATFIKTLQAQNMTVSQYREQLRDRVIVQAMRNRKTQNEVVVSPYKIEKYYKEHQDDYKIDDQIKLRMIFIKKAPVEAPAVPAASTNETASTSTNAAETAATTTPPPVDPRRKLGEEIVAKLDEGASFESMAKLYSEGKEAKEGGDWGWIGKDVLRKELNEVAFTLKPGQHSRLIDTAEGYYVLQVDDVKPAHGKPLAEVRDDIEKILLQQQRARMQETWVKELRAKAYIRLF
jgi:parvulin-like peptidyl-prolyl isomerase